MTEITHPLLEWLESNSDETKTHILALEHHIMLKRGKVNRNELLALARLQGRAEALLQAITMAIRLVSQPVTLVHDEEQST